MKIILTKDSDLDSVNEVYSEFFKEHVPARTIIRAEKLPLGASVEVVATAAMGDGKW